MRLRGEAAAICATGRGGSDLQRQRDCDQMFPPRRLLYRFCSVFCPLSLISMLSIGSTAYLFRPKLTRDGNDRDKLFVKICKHLRYIQSFSLVFVSSFHLYLVTN